ncbi:patatin-like phospholipase family protein [Variovorax terrae]|uniref:Patatin-like phospholipase family protein n=1 Tax=Variovorax terrae TaxID=2923278 RepID=A0A9X1W181_9BURK|nr:patatin-like phospholipase family protein [Variovorax terrae]MCJ0765929.1 patatin-like phospholipase family protein [Variovorax terrae]
MSLNTIINAGLTRPSRPTTALVLMGGGARTAYQVGVLQALAAMLGLQGAPAAKFPFQVLVGTSAGALNAAYLAGAATTGLQAFEQLAQFWSRIRSSAVYEFKVSPLVRASKLLAALSLSRHARRHGALLDNMPLVDTLHHAVSLPGIEEALRTRTLDALAVTASSYTSGVHWTFCHTAHDETAPPWNRPGRRADFQPITIEHLMASSAIPFLFPATPLWVDGQREFFGDGSMRQISPLSPAIHLGAHKVLVVGVGQPQRSGFASAAPSGPARMPSLGNIAGHAMASVFHDTLQADVEQAQRISQTLRQLPREVAAVLPYRGVEVLALQPSQSLDAIAQAHLRELPVSVRNALSGLGGLRGGAGLSSYLLFEPGFVQTLVALGEQDAYARKAQLLAFFAGS